MPKPPEFELSPIFDNIDHVINARKDKQYRVEPFFSGLVIDGAGIDYEYGIKFLATYDGSVATFNSYRREIERLMQWAWRVEKKAAHKLGRDDIDAFIKFCCAPPISWIGVINVARFNNKGGQRVPSPKWRPFTATVSKSARKAGAKASVNDYTMAPESVKAMIAILRSFYEYLVEEDVTLGNPVSKMRQKNKFIVKEQTTKSINRLTNLQWDYLIETATIMADENPGEHERTLFIMNCLFAMYLRISELVADDKFIPTMNCFKRDSHRNWWFNIRGKGNKSRRVAVSDAMLNALIRYRQKRELSPLPASNDQTPLLIKHRGKGPVRSSRHIREIIQSCFDAAFDRMVSDGLSEESSELQAATVHWLRHTGISEDVKTRPREHVRDDAGHNSAQTTERYIDVEDRERHLSGQKKQIVDG